MTVLLSMVACTAASEPEVTEDAPVRLELWYQPNGNSPERVMHEELRRFNAEHPDIAVEATMISWDETLTKLATATRSGAMPDVAFVGSTWLSDLDVGEVFHRFSGPDLVHVGGEEAFHAAALETGRDDAGELIGIPWMVETRLLFYRADLLVEAGVDPGSDLSDWRSFDEALRKLGRLDDVEAWALPGRNEWNVVHNALSWIWAAGGETVTEDGSSALTSKETVRGLRELQRLVTEHGDLSALADASVAVQEDFVQGRHAVTISGPWLAQTLERRLPDGMWGATPLPSGPGGSATLVGGSHLAIAGDTAHLDAALDLVAFLSSPASQQRVASEVSMVPSRVDVEVDGIEALATLDALGAARSYPRVPGWIDVEHALQRAFVSMWEHVEAGEALDDEELLALLTRVDREVAEAIARQQG